MYVRKLQLIDEDDISFFLWGARQTGKSTLLKKLFPDSLSIDLLDSSQFRRFLSRPEQLREIVTVTSNKEFIIIDEIQKIPALLNEVHWLIENGRYRFILSGSSPRKILQGGVNLLGGRALKKVLYPLSYSEIPKFDLLRAMNHGLLPRIYDSKNPERLLDAYIGSYLEDEIVAETKIRNTEIFGNFLTKAAFANGELLQYTNIAQDCGVSSPTVKSYYQILIDSMIGDLVQPYAAKPKRKVFMAPKFYFFDIGIANLLSNSLPIKVKSNDFGKAFEHFIYHEIRSYSEYSGKMFPISYWRTTSGYEVDFILGQHQIAIEVKSTDNVQSKHLKGLKAFNEEYQVERSIVISQDEFHRKLQNDIEVIPWKVFLDLLWSGKLI